VLERRVPVVVALSRFTSNRRRKGALHVVSGQNCYRRSPLRTVQKIKAKIADMQK